MHISTKRELISSTHKREVKKCTALVVGCDDVASCYSVGVLTRGQVDSWEGSREARVVADS